MSIVLQLKSAHKPADLGDITRIRSEVLARTGYRIRGHEIQQLQEVMAATSLSERVATVATFCARNEIEYMTYHCPIYQNGENIWDDRWRQTVRSSILLTAREAEKVYSAAGLDHPVVVVAHLTNYVPLAALPVTRESKFKMVEDTEREFLDLCRQEGLLDGARGCQAAVENSYPKYSEEYASTSPFHPAELARLAACGVKTVFDISHFKLYSNYIDSGGMGSAPANQCGDLDREIYGGRAPSWQECIRILSESLVQLHISDARGTQESGEGLPLGGGSTGGEIPVVQVLSDVASEMKKEKRTIQGTIELGEGHLYRGRLQLQSALWLVNNLPPGVLA